MTMNRFFSTLALAALPALAGCIGSAPTGDDPSLSAEQQVEEASFDKKFYDKAWPWCQSNGSYGIYWGAEDLRVGYAKFEVPNEKGAIVMVPGRTEPVEKYCEMAYDLRNSGWSLYITDLRGQGRSDRMADDSQKGYVDSWKNYVEDFDTFVQEVVKTKSHPRMVVMSHSTGGAVVTNYLADHPAEFDGAVLVSPMHKINTDPYNETVAYMYASASCIFGKGEDYAPGAGPYDPNAPFADNDVTHSEERYDMFRWILGQNPDLAIGGATFRWVREAIEMSRHARSHAHDVVTPTLLLQAGGDTVVIPSAQNEVCDEAVDCTLVSYDGAYHELLMEKDPIRNQVMGEIKKFLVKMGK